MFSYFSFSFSFLFFSYYPSHPLLITAIVEKFRFLKPFEGPQLVFFGETTMFTYFLFQTDYSSCYNGKHTEYLQVTKNLSNLSKMNWENLKFSKCQV